MVVRTVRKPQIVAMESFFEAIGVRIRTLDPAVQRSFLEVTRYQYVTRDELVVPYADSGHVVFVAEGLVREQRNIDTVRLWKPGVILGNWTGVPIYTMSFVMTRSSASVFHARATDVVKLIMQHPYLGLHFAQAEAMRARDAEKVYGATRLGPAPRVAALLLYLARYDDPIYHREPGGGRTVIGISDNGVVQGVTQQDLADGLALGLATVERVIANLRKDGILAAPEPGGPRKNRHFMIKDKMRLEQLAYS